MTNFSVAKARSILMSPPMVEALWRGWKTQTRRIMQHPKELRPLQIEHFTVSHYSHPNDWSRKVYYFLEWETDQARETLLVCPYGDVGNLLYVKETCWIWGAWHKDGLTKTGKQQYRFKPVGQDVSYIKQETVTRESGETGWVKRNSIFMPRWAARIYLEITNVRVERLQDITEEDCMAEGVRASNPCGGCSEDRWGNCIGCQHPWNETPREAYKVLFESINGIGTWNDNPWVFVLEFKVVQS